MISPHDTESSEYIVQMVAGNGLLVRAGGHKVSAPRHSTNLSRLPTRLNTTDKATRLPVNCSRSASRLSSCLGPRVMEHKTSDSHRGVKSLAIDAMRLEEDRKTWKQEIKRLDEAEKEGSGPRAKAHAGHAVVRSFAFRGFVSTQSLNRRWTCRAQ